MRSSRLGAYLDPIADKVLLSGTFLVLALTGAIEPWLAAVVLGRDLIILAAAGVLYLATARRNFPPSPWGKISTFVQIVFLCFQIGYLSGIAVAPAVTALKWLTVRSGHRQPRRLCPPHSHRRIPLDISAPMLLQW